AAATPLLTSSAALCWGLQFALLNPVLALLLVGLYDAGPADVGWVLGVYNASGFVAALGIPSWADRRKDYLRPLLVCGALTLALAGTLAITTALPVAVVALVVLGGPAGVGVSLLFADMKHAKAAPSEVINTRAIVSFAWVAGPPLATFIMAALGNRAILPVLAVIAFLNMATTAGMIAKRRAAKSMDPDPDPTLHAPGQPVSRTAVVLIVSGFVALQATNSAAVSVMSLFVTERLGLPLIWSGVALGISALLEIPALLIIGRLSRRFSSQAILATGCVAGVAYYAAMTVLTGPVLLIAVQPLNAWFFGTVAGIGLTLFQDLIPGPGLASGLFTNTRRIGAIVSGVIIAAGPGLGLGYQGVFGICAVAAFAALILIGLSRRTAPKA
ncbi:MAG: MFS transporter, partial [Arthrobacter sp.]